MKRLLPILLSMPILVSCQERPAVLGPDGEALFSRTGPGRPGSAVIRFGDPRAGSPFPPQEEHDASYHAADKLVPRTVVIPVGGSVLFEVAPTHIVAIYEPGTRPEDIELSPATLEDLPVPFPPFLLPDFLINDPNGRVAFQGTNDLFAPRTFSHTFPVAGRYLVICAFTPHFAVADMYGWVIVQ